MEQNPYEASCRARKAAALTAFLRQHLGAKATAANVEQFGADEWARIAELAKVNPPSARTIAVIVDGMRRTEADADPFASLVA